MKTIKYLFLIIWALWCFVGIFKNYTHYKSYDWVVIIIFTISPYIIVELISKKNKNSIEKIRDTTDQEGKISMQDINQLIESESPISYIETDNNTYPIDRKTISDKEVPYSIQTEYEQAVSAEKNSRNAIGYKFSNYMGMKIVPNTYPAKDGYNCLNENEKMFFQEFYQQLIAAKLSPYLIKLTRLSNGGFNVDYTTLCYVGKINLYQSPASYLVIKNGNKRASKKFHTLQEAEAYISQKEEYSIEARQPKDNNSMQYLRGASTIKNLSNLSVEQCIEYIPYWIRYIKYCKRN